MDAAQPHAQPAPPAGPLRPGVLVPMLILGFLLLDGALRLIPMASFATRAWEAMLPTRMLGPFRPDHNYHSEHTHGDLVLLGNWPQYAEYRREDFTTDHNGMRNPPDLRTRPVGGVMIGDSFGVGAGVTDDQTLTAQVQLPGGLKLYNAAAGPTLSVPDLQRLLRGLKLQRPLVLFEYYECRPIPDLADATHAKYLGPDPGPEPPPQLAARLWDDMKQSRMEIMGLHLYSWLHPEWHDAQVLPRRLRDNQVMLFYKDEVQRFYDPPQTPIDYWVWLQRGLQREGLELRVLLVPSKFRVYQPLFRKELGPLPAKTPYLLRLETELRAAGVPVLNVTGALQERAAAELAQGQYLYFKDDTHWNSRGIAVTAERVSQWLKTP